MFKQLIFKLIPRFRFDDITAYAAQISFYLLLSLFPFFILLVSVLTHTNLIDINQLMEMMRSSNIFPEIALRLIEDTFSGVTLPSASISFYIIVVLWSASRGIRAVMNGIHMAFRTREAHNLIVRFLLSFFYTLCFVLMVVLFIALVVFGDALFSWLSSTFHLFFLISTLMHFIRYLIPLVFMLLLYTLLYKVIPGKELRIRDVLPGSLFAALSSFLISQGFSIYTSHFANYSLMYGSISGIIVICTWMYLFSLMMVLGAEINACLYEITHNTSLLKIR
ncbi:MAG: YihY/virulence factor BrkB family protein [Lachnospiraceae bacterium]|nr:YihY/virulence factor BrkB family protein [Lachnospiraceae bacterium]